MDSNITAIFNNGGLGAEDSEPPPEGAVAGELDWPARLRMFARRSAAGTIDLIIMSSLSLFFLGLPMGASMAFSIWEPAASSTPTGLSVLIEHALQAAAVMAVLTQLYFYTALAESSPAQASLGKILMGLKTSDASGNRQTFRAALWRLNLQYTAFLLVCTASYCLVDLAADFIVSLHIEQLRTLMKWLIVLASFLLCLVTDREQNLYDMLTGRLIFADETVSFKERLGHFGAQLKTIFAALNPLNQFDRSKKDKGAVGEAPGMVTLLLVVWSYVSAAAGAAFVFLACLIGLSMNEVESGITTQGKQQPGLAAQHFGKALKLSPGIAVVYQYFYMLNDNLDLAKQDAAGQRLFALRGNAQDCLFRGRVRAKQHEYAAAASDYRKALSGSIGPLDPHENEVATTELSLLLLEQEAASAPNPPALPMHTVPFDTDAPDSGFR